MAAGARDNATAMDALSSAGTVLFTLIVWGGWPFYWIQRFGSHRHGFVITLALSFAALIAGVVATDLGLMLGQSAGIYVLWAWAVIPYVLILIHRRRLRRIHPPR